MVLGVEAMEEKNKLVIRVKYQGLNTELKNSTQLAKATKWDVKKVGIALVIFIALIFLAFNVSMNNSLKPSGIFGDEYKVIEKNSVVKKVNEVEKITKIEVLKQDIKMIEPVAPLDINIARALLTTRVDNKEPIDNITSIIVNKK